MWTCEAPEAGLPPRDEPVEVGTDADWAAVAAGLGHVVPLKTDGTPWGWGLDPADAVDLEGRAPRTLPEPTGTDADGAAVDAGYTHTAALKRDGTLWSWESSHLGSLGDGTTSGGRPRCRGRAAPRGRPSPPVTG